MIIYNWMRRRRARQVREMTLAELRSAINTEHRVLCAELLVYFGFCAGLAVQVLTR